MEKRFLTRPLAGILLLVLLLSGCGGQGPVSSGLDAQAPVGEEDSVQDTFSPRREQEVQKEQGGTEEKRPGGDPVQAMLEQMTVREKVGQLFIVQPEALVRDKDQERADPLSAGRGIELTQAMADALGEYPVGGVILFSRNIVSPQQVTAFNADLQSASAIPLFLSVDEEGGAVARLANNPAFDLPVYESAAAVGATGDPAQAREMGAAIGGYLKEYGFNMDFAPDADVNTNPDNPVIGDRAFSGDAQIAAQMAAAMAQGLRDQGIIPVFKHFPGHGDTAQDSHLGTATTDKTAQEMQDCEWLPFQRAGSADCVMVGHIAAPALTGDLTPATQSSAMVEDILKGELGFQGLVITDSLSMGAIVESYAPGEAALGALEAGCDLLLMPEDLKEAFDAVVAAVEDGTISRQRLDESVGHILSVKLAYEIWEP